MAPEVIEGRLYDYKIDIWSIGVVAYCMLYSKYPFNEQVDAEQIKAIKNFGFKIETLKRN